MFERYAVFYTPTGPLAEFGAQWLGWDSAKGCAVQHPTISNLDLAMITETPRKYGLHGTLKAPFRPAAGTGLPQLRDAAKAFAAQHSAFEIGPLALRYESGFVALRPSQNVSLLKDFAAATVRAFDLFRAPLTGAEIARRRETKLTARQDQQMLDWGYPFIFDDFHFHLTLSGRLTQDAAAPVTDVLTQRLDRVVSAPLVIDAITLMGQDKAGMFHQIHRYALTG